MVSVGCGITSLRHTGNIRLTFKSLTPPTYNFQRAGQWTYPGNYYVFTATFTAATGDLVTNGIPAPDDGDDDDVGGEAINTLIKKLAHLFHREISRRKGRNHQVFSCAVWCSGN